jgi:hypothetical protein
VCLIVLLWYCSHQLSKQSGCWSHYSSCCKQLWVKEREKERVCVIVWVAVTDSESGCERSTYPFRNYYSVKRWLVSYL